ncbi:MAG: class I SAM-dependent methyltransferase [Anaerolineae bacterium]|nr:class I SAM-dependent methyltransferase [Phycisphaerae bacterium]
MNCYKKLCTEFYDTDKPTAPRDALEFYLRYAEQSAGPFLEPMCGPGRFLIPLRQRGFDIDGFDASPHMLAACREKLKLLGLNANVTEQSLPEIDLPRKYGLVIIPAGSLGLITDEVALDASLKRLRELMLPNAKLVVEVGQRKPKESGSWPWGGRWIDRADGARLIISWLSRYDASTSIASSVHRYELIKDCQLLATEFEEFNLRHSDLPEMTARLAAAGFERITALKIYEQRPPDDADEEVVLECSRE